MNGPRIAWFALCLSLFSPSAYCLEPPSISAQHKRELIRQAHKVWGIDAPVATLAAQIHQESYWQPRVVSRTGAVSLSQFMPATADWLESKHPALAQLARSSSSWAFYAQSLYMRELEAGVDRFDDHCERMGFALQSYVGGSRWVAQRQRLSPKPGVCLFLTCRINPGIAIHNQREASEYPERILIKLEPLYRSWGPGRCSN